jgi:hypothetical protein
LLHIAWNWASAAWIALYQQYIAFLELEHIVHNGAVTRAGKATRAFSGFQLIWVHLLSFQIFLLFSFFFSTCVFFLIYIPMF